MSLERLSQLLLIYDADDRRDVSVLRRSRLVRHYKEVVCHEGLLAQPSRFAAGFSQWLRHTFQVSL